MQKISIIIVFIFLLKINANSQEDEITKSLIFEKGKISLSGSINGGFESNGNYSLNFNVSPGIFIINKLKLGTQFGISKSNISFNYKSFHIMPVAEYYILNKRISPIVRTGFMWEIGRMDNQLFINKSLMAGIGLAYINKSKTFGINVSADYYFSNMNMHKGIMPNISFNFYLNRKKDRKVLY